MAIVCFVVVGCGSEERAELDLELQELLKVSSNGIGSSHYRLPSSEAYHLIPQDPLNPIDEAKVALGKLLFHETGLGVRPKYSVGHACYSCASCHHAGGGFQANKKQGIGDGGWGFGTAGEGRDKASLYADDSVDVQPIRTPSALNVAYQELMLWNGQFGAGGDNIGTEAEWTEGTPKAVNHLGYEGVEVQAIAGLKVHRMDVDKELLVQLAYLDLFDEVFHDFPVDKRYTKETAGLAIAAFERTILATKAPFQEWLKGDFSAMSEKEKEGALLFFGDANCAHCHNGPALNSMDFYALGMEDLDGEGLYGKLKADDVVKGRGGFTKRPEDMYKFKVPQLYNLKSSLFLGHGGNFRSIREVVSYKNLGIKENAAVPSEALSSHFVPLHLTEGEVDKITSFIEHALFDPNLDRFTPKSLPSNLCFPNADQQSIEDLGCQ